MINKISRYLELGPALFYAMLSVYIIISYLLEKYPSSIVIWKTFYIMSPILREPINLIKLLYPFNILQLMAILIYATFAGFFATAEKYRIFHFFYFHAAFLLLLHAIHQERISRISNVKNLDLTNLNNDPRGSFSGEFTEMLSSWNLFGMVLFAIVTLACISWHLKTWKRLYTNRSN